MRFCVFRSVFSRNYTIKMNNKMPLVVILGSTGTGKTKLSIELVKRFNGEIISADSMQVYKDLDIVTAKATKDEQLQAKHHLLDVVTPEQTFTVMHFREAAIPIIDDLLANNKMPIVVGGTNYYIESILWKILVQNTIKYENVRRKSDLDISAHHKKFKLDINKPSTSSNEIDFDEKESDDNDKESKNENDFNYTFDRVMKMTVKELESQPSELLHECLKIVDPDSANRLHPNNRRKVIRALEVFIENGRTLTSIYEEQRNEPGGCRLGGPLRYANVVLFWLRCNQDTLNARLDARVDSMVSQGLLKEIRQFHVNYVKPYENKDYHKGILQSIGFKEFIHYLEKYDDAHDALITNYMKGDKSSDEPPEGLPLLNHCLDALKLVTRRYSKRQLKWINHRFLGHSTREVPDLFELDTSDVGKWKENVFDLAENVVVSAMNGNKPNVEPMKKLKNPREGMNEEVTNFCKECNVTLIGEYQWNIHIRSNKHKKCVAGVKKLESKKVEK